ncbi:MAG: hypothetical protein ACYSW6_10980 [Planctomycetota bacterium]|jgi:predicted nuclease with TOPRIM domain
MKLVTWEDERGYTMQSYLPDGTADDLASTVIPHNPPDLSEIDWEEVAKEMHNALVAQGLITWQDVQRQQTTLVPVIVSSVKRRLIALYRKKEEL